MKHFTSVDDVSDPMGLVQSALEFKTNPMKDRQTGEGLTLGLIFFNPSLRTRLSTQKAASNLGISCITLNIQNGGWELETEDGVVMKDGAAEHIREAAGVIGRYCDIVGVRSFPGLQDREKDYKEEIICSFMKYSGIPVVSLESATLHPLQSLADLLTIEEHKQSKVPKVVLTWAPHPKVLPQSVANSFAQWMSHSEAEFVIAHPEGFELSPGFVNGAKVTYNQEDALRDADFVYTKNWSSYTDYGKTAANGTDNWKITAQKNGTDQQRKVHALPAGPPQCCCRLRGIG